MSATTIIKSFSGHMYTNSKPENVFANIDKARKEDKSINLTTGRFVQNHKKYTYWYHDKYPFAIPIELAISQNEANRIFDAYINSSQQLDNMIDTNIQIVDMENVYDSDDQSMDDSYESDFIDDTDEPEYMDGDSDYTDI